MSEPTAHTGRVIPSLDDYTNNDQPIFQAIFGEAWEKLPTVLRSHAEETALDDSNFDMCVEIRHPWRGRICGYRGRFTISEEQ